MEQTIIQTDFAKDILKGLSADSKFLSSKYFYDEKGSKIFQDIMQMPEYYLTDCELEIFQTKKQEIFEAFTNGENKYDIIELGAGDGSKTKVLLSHFIHNNISFEYIPIDISEEAIRNLIIDLEKELPSLKTNGMVGDYFHLMEDLNQYDFSKKILMFLGSNIGNFSWLESIDFFKKLHSVMRPKDLLFIGFDLKKDPATILNAYNDPHGHTSRFNLNLLQRINTELNADFNLKSFKHKEIYSPQTGTAKSFLVSQKKQEVRISDLNKTISFKEGESIFMEISQKFDEEMIKDLAENSGFEIVRNFQDERLYFMNSLWKLND